MRRRGIQRLEAVVAAGEHGRLFLGLPRQGLGPRPVVEREQPVPGERVLLGAVDPQCGVKRGRAERVSRGP